MTDAFLLQAT